MRSAGLIVSFLAVLPSRCTAELNVTQHVSRQILPSSFSPPQVYRNNNLIRNIHLTKSYAKESVNVVVENVDKAAQTDYYLPFEAHVLSRLGGLEVRDKNNANTKFPPVEIVEFDVTSTTQYCKISFPKPLQSGERITLSMSWVVLSVLTPLPAAIDQAGKQYLQYNFSAYSPAAYQTLKQKTNLKLASSDIPDFTKLSKNADGKDDPQKQGSSLTYGPYGETPAGAVQLVTARYEFTKPVLYAALLERDIEVSHWGGNLATEERYWLENRGAKLKKQFSRVEWAQSQYYNPPTAALKELRFPLAVGSLSPYFTDDIGNVSTSRFRSNAREANLELKPRYPIFGGWKYKFKVGWDANLAKFLKRIQSGDSYVLKVPFLEGPQQQEGVSYGRVVFTAILPEGAINVKFETSMPLISSELSQHRTFMDTLGRTSLKLTAINVADEMRDREVLITYDYPFLASFRKPLVIFSSALGVFATAWLVSKLDVSIGRKR